MVNAAEQVAEEVERIVQVQHLRLVPGDVLAFICNGRITEQQMADVRARIKANVPDGVKVCVLFGGTLAVLPEAPQGVEVL